MPCITFHWLVDEGPHIILTGRIGSAGAIFHGAGADTEESKRFHVFNDAGVLATDKKKKKKNLSIKNIKEMSRILPEERGRSLVKFILPPFYFTVRLLFSNP